MIEICLLSGANLRSCVEERQPARDPGVSLLAEHAAALSENQMAEGKIKALQSDTLDPPSGYG